MAHADVSFGQTLHAGGQTGANWAVAGGFRAGRSLLVALVVGLLVFLGSSAPAAAGTVIVDSTGDSATGCPTAGACTLRSALATSLPQDTIEIQAVGTITISAPLVISKSVTILGQGPSRTIIDANNGSRVFDVATNIDVAMTSVAIRRGRAIEGAGILNSGRLTLTGVLIEDNVVPASEGRGGGISNTAAGTLQVFGSVIRDNLVPGGHGAGIASSGTATVTHSLLTGGTAGTGGGIANFSGTLTVSNSTLRANNAGIGGGIANAATAIIERSTLAGNGAGSGGAVSTDGETSVVTITNSTLSANAASSGGAIFINYGRVDVTFSTVLDNESPQGSVYTRGSPSAPSDGIVTLRNSIVYRNAVGPVCAGNIVSMGNNLSDTTACYADPGKADIVNASAVFGPLQLNGPGRTETHDLLGNNPAIDGVLFNSATDCLSNGNVTDQRGVQRPQMRKQPRCDIGAFERDTNVPPTITVPTAQTTPEDTVLSGPTVVVTVGDIETLLGNLQLTAQSSNQELVPNAAVTFSGNAAARMLTITPAANKSGVTEIKLTVSDGTESVSSTFTLTVTPVNDAPVAVNDTYTGSGGQALQVGPAQGVLANDTDLEGTTLRAEVVQAPAHGTVTIDLAGGFVYIPVVGFAGTDTFTYRASDGDKSSSPATVTVTVTAVSVSACSPRPRIVSTPVVDGGKLNVQVASTALTNQQNNPLQQVVFDKLENARVTMNGQQVTPGQPYTVPANTVAVSFTVERLTPGQPTMAYFTIVDSCGPWTTFVGSGAGGNF